MSRHIPALSGTIVGSGAADCHRIGAYTPLTTGHRAHARTGSICFALPQQDMNRGPLHSRKGVS